MGPSECLREARRRSEPKPTVGVGESGPTACPVFDALRGHQNSDRNYSSFIFLMLQDSSWKAVWSEFRQDPLKASARRAADRS